MLTTPLDTPLSQYMLNQNGITIKIVLDRTNTFCYQTRIDRPLIVATFNILLDGL